MLKKICIYLLIDPRYNNVRYIGQTNNISRRFREHLLEAKSGKNTHKNNWIMSLIKNNLKPEIEIIELDLNNSEGDFWEQHYISLYKSFGFYLVNKTNGGESKEEKSRLKISAKLKGHSMSEYTKQKLKESRKGKTPWNKGLTKSDSRVKKYADKNIGKKHSEQTRRKISKSHAGKKAVITEEVKKKISETLKGHKVSEETKRKISETLKNKKN